jgi:SAM-dependent methyltransferase
LTIDEAVRALREDPEWADLVRDAYLGRDVAESIDRFARSAEFAEAVRMIGDPLVGATIVDLGAGVGLASASFRKLGAGRVIAVEPDDSDEVGRGAIRRTGIDVEIMDAVGESLPIESSTIDVVYARQVLHHAQDLERLVAEVARVLRPSGRFIACREHVVSDDLELKQFLAAHPVHVLAGGEHAWPLQRYVRAIRRSGLHLDRVIAPWDSIINAYPTVRSTEELRTLPSERLISRFGRAGAVAARVPGVTALVRRRLTGRSPGRLYSFVATRT